MFDYDSKAEVQFIFLSWVLMNLWYDLAVTFLRALNPLCIMIFILHFLAVQDSSIGDIVTLSLTH